MTNLRDARIAIIDVFDNNSSAVLSLVLAKPLVATRSTVGILSVP